MDLNGLELVGCVAHNSGPGWEGGKLLRKTGVTPAALMKGCLPPQHTTLLHAAETYSYRIGHFSHGVGFRCTYMPDLPSRGGGWSTLAHWISPVFL
jgi:hypothetical protein